MDDQEQTTYVIKRTTQDVRLPDGNILHAGWHRMNLARSGLPVEHPVQFSVDGQDWTDHPFLTDSCQFSDLFSKTLPLAMAEQGVQMEVSTIERMEYFETIEYRGRFVPLFIDWNGQEVFAIYDNRLVGLGSYSPEEPLDQIVEVVDHDLDGKRAVRAKATRATPPVAPVLEIPSW